MIYGKKCPKCEFHMDEFIDNTYRCQECDHTEPMDDDIPFGNYFIAVVLIIIAVLISSSYAEANDDTKYMSEAIYFEARDQVLLGQVAVGCVILNRVNDNSSRWLNTVRNVVHQPQQFSYFSDGKPEVYNDHKSHYIAWLMAEKVLHSNVCDMFGGIDHYMNHDLTNKTWYKSMEFVMTIGDHSFYKEIR